MEGCQYCVFNCFALEPVRMLALSKTNFKIPQFSDNVIMLPLCQLAEFECYPHLAPLLPLAMDDKALTHFLSVTTFSAVTQCALWIISHMSLPHSEVPKKRIRVKMKRWHFSNISLNINQR